MCVRIYYDDGSRYEGDWMDAPAWGVQFVSWPDPVVGTDFCYGRSYFFLAPWMDGEPVSADAGGLYDYLRGTKLGDIPISEIRPSALIKLGVKFGRTISNRSYHDLLARVKSETDWSGQYPSRKPDRALG